MDSFNQRARDSSSLERTKKPRRFVRVFAAFSFLGSLHTTRADIENAIVHCYNKIVILNQYFNYTLQTALRVASFSEKLTNLPMWSHYANEHKGICFEYDISKIVDPYIKNRLFPVKYAPSLPNAIALMEERMAEHKQPSFTLYDYFAMSKLDDWAYEKEWRLIINLGLEMVKQEDAEGKLAGQGMLHWFEKPSKIYFGAKIPEAQKATIKELCKNHNIEMRQMKCTEYGLKDFPME